MAQLGLARLLGVQEVAGSNPAAPTKFEYLAFFVRVIAVRRAQILASNPEKNKKAVVRPGLAQPKPTEEKPDQEVSFADSKLSLVLLIAAIFLARWYVMEPFKIPSGSMEPTLIGHEDYGDRILTNKLAYASQLHVIIAMGVSLLLILAWMALTIVYSAKRDLRSHWKAAVITVVLIVMIVGGIGFGWASGAVGAEPKRFDVMVFQYSTNWGVDEKDPQDINYIKRLIGMPGDTLAVSGGDLFLQNPTTKKFEMIRKWEKGSIELQEKLWYPVSKAWSVPYSAGPKPKAPTAGEPDYEAKKKKFDEESERFEKITRQIDEAAFPWKITYEGESKAKAVEKAFEVDAKAPVELTYAHQVTNTYIKQGRWPFQHVNCPAAHKPDINGMRDPTQTSEFMTAYVSNTWEGIRCPNCGSVAGCDSVEERVGPQFRGRGIALPIEGAGEIQPFDRLFRTPSSDAQFGAGYSSANFFYGGDYVVGDLKLDTEIEVEASGSIKIEVGNSRSSSVWQIPSDGSDKDTPTTHPVQKATAALAPGKHSLSLSYIDATVVAVLDGNEIERRPVDVVGLVPWEEYHNMKSLAHVSFDAGFKGKMTMLNLFRDLFHTPGLDRTGFPRENPANKSVFSMSRHDEADREYQDGSYIAHIPEGKYLMMGDNSPSSTDGRVWGFVPRDRLVGRAGVVWWPPSRWRSIK